MEQPPVRTASMTLRDFIRVLRTRKWTIVISVVVFIALSVVYDYQKTPEYTATAKVQLLPQLSPALLEANNSGLANNATSVDVPTDTQVFESTIVADRVKDKVKHAPPVSVTQVGVTDVVDVSVTSTDAHLATRAANAYASAYIAIQQSQAISALSNASKIIQQHIDNLQSQINGLQAQLQNVSSANTQEQSTISSQIASLSTSQSALRSQLSTYQTASSLSTGGGQVVSKATVPKQPSAPKPVEYGILALLVGLVVGIGVASLQEYLDEKLRSIEDLEGIMGDTPIIGLIPPVTEWKNRGKPYLISLRSPTSPPSEAYRSLRTNIQFLGLDREFHKVLLSSPRSSEGKTTTVANLALTMAQSGQRILVVDCDLRRPRLHAFFDLSYSVGFTSALVGDVAVNEAVFEIPGLQNLAVMPSGIIPPNPSELLAGRRAQEIFATLSNQYDLVLIDSPPLLPVTDAVVLAPRVDAVVMVASAGLTTRHDLRRARETLERVEAPLAGVVWNRARGEDVYADYRYSYVYGTEQERASSGGPESSNGNTRRRAHAAASGGRRSLGA